VALATGSIAKPSGEAMATSTPAISPSTASERATLLPSPT
jgi:hypothetical protein